MRIAFVSWRDLANDLAGGSEIYVDRLARGLLGMGHEVAHLCGGPVGERPYRVVDLGGTFSQYLRAPIAHRRTVGQWDLLVDVENGLPFFSPLWRRKPILGVVHHVHADQWQQRFVPPLAAAGRFTEAKIMPRVYRRTPFVVASPSTAIQLAELGVDKERIHVVVPGVEVPSGTEDRSPTPLFICAGRLVPHKRVELVLRAWEQVRPVTGGQLVVIGEGPERANLEAVAGTGVRFAGKVDEEEKWRLFRQAWLLVHPAHHEGWGIVITEAAAVGTPSLGFDVPGVRDAIVDGTSGTLVDTESELVERWIDVATDAAFRRKLSEGARRAGSSFDWGTAARKFEAIALQAVESATG